MSFYNLLLIVMIAAQKKENPNLATLRNQMKDMSEDFEDMKNARIESKR